jgi:general secretion pathway protein N
MRGRRWSAALPPLLLVVICVALGGRVYDEWLVLQEPVPIDAPPAAAAVAAPAAADAPIVPPTPSSFAAILERPLFSPTRRPPAAAPALAPTPEAAAPAPPAQPIDFSLAGIVISDGSRVALVQMQADGRVVQVAEGGEVDGWKAVTIEPQRAVFRRGDDEQELALDYVKPVPPGQVPPPVPQRTPERLSQPPAAPQPQPPPAEPAGGGALDSSTQQ